MKPAFALLFLPLLGAAPANSSRSANNDEEPE
jgi:hypothetical protein